MENDWERTATLLKGEINVGNVIQYVGCLYAVGRYKRTGDRGSVSNSWLSNSPFNLPSIR